MKVKEKYNLKKYLIIEIVLIILFIINTIFVKLGAYSKIDNIVFDFVNKIPDSFSTFFYIITNIGGTTFLPIIACLICLIFYFSKYKKQSLDLIIVLLSSSMLNTFLKVLIKRPRYMYPRFGLEKRYSYPSGHSVNNFVFYTMVIYFLNKDINLKIKDVEKEESSLKNNENIQLKNLKILKIFIRYVSYFLGLYIFLVMLSRIYFRYHYFSDVIGAILEGLVILNLNFYCCRKKEVL